MHPTDSLHHEHEVAQGSRAHGPPGTRAQDNGDLGDNPRCQRIPVENGPVLAQAFLNSCSAGVDQPDNRAPRLDRLIHRQADLLCMLFSQRTP